MYIDEIPPKKFFQYNTPSKTELCHTNFSKTIMRNIHPNNYHYLFNFALAAPMRSESISEERADSQSKWARGGKTNKTISRAHKKAFADSIHTHKAHTLAYIHTSHTSTFNSIELLWLRIFFDIFFFLLKNFICWKIWHIYIYNTHVSSR